MVKGQVKLVVPLMHRKVMALSAVNLVEAAYPRLSFENFDRDQVNELENSVLEDLPEIVVTKSGTLVDGFHRLMALKAKGIREGTVKVIPIQEKDVFLWANYFNSRHGVPLTKEQKKANMRRLVREGYDYRLIADAMGYTDRYGWDVVQRELAKRKNAKRGEALKLVKAGLSQRQAAKKLHLAHKSVSRWVKEEEQGEGAVSFPANTENDTHLNDQIRHLVLRGFMSDEIVSRLNSSDNVVNEAIAKMTVVHRGDYQVTPEHVWYYNVWLLHGRGNEAGISYPGACSGELVENFLWWYTKPFSVVVDPMAGGGTTLDVAWRMNRVCLGYDINPIRPEIQPWDIRKGYPERVKGKMDCAFLDPPYYKKLVAEYGDNSVSSLNREEFLSFIEFLGSETYASLRPIGIAGLLISHHYDGEHPPDSEKPDCIFWHEYITRFEKAGFLTLNVIDCPYPVAIKDRRAHEKAVNNRFMLDISRVLLVFKKDEGRADAAQK